MKLWKVCKSCGRVMPRTRLFWWLAGYCNRECWVEHHELNTGG